MFHRQSRNRSRKSTANSRGFKPRLESLDRRDLPSVAYSILDTNANTVLSGTTVTDTFAVSKSLGNNVVINGVDTGVPSANILLITLQGDGAGVANDTFDLSKLQGADYPNLQLVDLNGGAGGNSLKLNDDAHTVFILGNDGADSAVYGSSYSLFIGGTASITGGAANDQFVFSDGMGLSGAVDGKGGVNSLGYDSYTTPVSVNLALGTATNMGSISNFQNVSGGSGDDLLIGTAGNNSLTGNPGNDTIDTGAGGTDLLDGFAGDNLFIMRPAAGADFTVFGGPDQDTISFANATTGVTINMDTTADQVFVPGAKLRFLIPGEVESFIGSPFSDDITAQPLFGHTRFIDGNSPVLPTLPGDALHLDLLGAFPTPDNSALTLSPPGAGAYSADNLNTLTFKSIETLSANAPISNVTINGSATYRDFRVVRNGLDEEVRNITGGFVPGTLLFSAPYSLLSSLTINGTTAFTNRVVLDFGGSGTPIPAASNPIPGNFTFNGRGINDGPTVLGDQFDVAGGGPALAAFSAVTVSYSGPTSGGATFVDTNPLSLGTANFSNVDGMNLTGGSPGFFANSTKIDALTVVLPASATDTTLEDFGTPADGVSRVRSTGAAQIIPTLFPNPATLIRVDTTAAGAQSVRLASMDSNFAPAGDEFIGDAADLFQLTSNNFLRTPLSGVTLADAKFDMNGFSDAAAYFEGDGELALTAGGSLSAGDATNHTFSGAVTGTGGLTKIGTGVWTLSGAVNNTYTGVTAVNNGTLELKKDPGFQAVGGNLLIGTNSGTDDSCVVLLTGASEQIINTSVVTMFVSGLLDLNGFSETIGPLNTRSGTSFGSTVDGGGGSLTVGGAVIVAQSGSGGGGVDIINGTLNLGTAALLAGRRRFSVINGAASTDLLVTMTVTGSAGLQKDGPGLMEMTATGNNYVGSTTIIGGILRVSGSLTGAGAAPVSLDGPGVVFEGGPSGVRLVSGRGVVVTSTGTAVRNFVQITNSTSGAGIRLNPGSSAAIHDIGTSAADGLRGNHTAIDVDGGVARISDCFIGYDGGVPNVSDGFSYPGGLRVRGGGKVDAGQPVGSFDFTGLGVSLGGNNFANFDTGAVPVTGSPTPPSYRQAILNLNTNSANALAGPQGVPTDVMAQGNTFDGVLITGNYTVAERQVYHDVDRASRGFVNYVNPASPNATLVEGPRFYSVTPTAAANNGWNQRSMIRRARVSYDNFVFLNLSSGGVTLNRLASPDVDAEVGRTPGPVTVVQASGSFDYLTGRFHYDLGFTTYSVETSGSLMDGKYSMTFNPNIRTLHPTFGLSASPPSPNPVVFHRLFGDADGSGQTTNSDYSAFLAAFNTISSSPNYREYFDFDNDQDVDSADRAQFLSRLNRYSSPI